MVLSCVKSLHGSPHNKGGRKEGVMHTLEQTSSFVPAQGPFAVEKLFTLKNIMVAQVQPQHSSAPACTQCLLPGYQL